MQFLQILKFILSVWGFHNEMSEISNNIGFVKYFRYNQTHIFTSLRDSRKFKKRAI